MLQNKLVRSSDGEITIIDSSKIISCEFTEAVNSKTNLAAGDVTASEITVEMLSVDPVQQDDILTYYVIEDGTETQIGVFKAEKPTVASKTTMRFSAYDNIIKTEKSFSDWLRTNQNMFPMPLISLVEYACSYCGVALATTAFPHSDLVVNAFYADDITCRQILAWAGAVAGRFVRANATGAIEFAWYASSTNINIVPNQGEGGTSLIMRDDGLGNVYIASDDMDVQNDDGNLSVTAGALYVTDDGAGNISLSADTYSIPFLQGALSYENYTTDLIERVQLNHSEDDVGVIYPADATGNCYTISKNMILGVANREDLGRVAEGLYEQLNSITYVPFSVTVPRTARVRAGDKVTVRDANGNSFESFVMKVSVAPSGTTLSATGDKSYGSNVAVSSEKYDNLTGKILSISKSIDGLVVKNEDLDGKVSSLITDTEFIQTYVETKVVTADSFELYKSEMTQTATNYEQRFTSLDEYRKETEANIRTGLLDYTEDNRAVFGIEIGQKTTDDEGADIFNKYARFTSDKLSFYDQRANEVASVGDRKLSIANAEITGDPTPGSTDYGSFKIGGFVDTVQEDGSVVTKWVRGGK